LNSLNAVGHAGPKPKYLAAKLLAIRKTYGTSQRWMAQLLQVEHHRHISEFERGLRIPSLVTLLYYSRIAGIPLEYIADDDFDLKTFQQKLNQVEQNRGEIVSRVILFYRSR
jgi:transcriptional regulator with XRE-family HTH domain